MTCHHSIQNSIITFVFVMKWPSIRFNHPNHVLKLSADIQTSLATRASFEGAPINIHTHTALTIHLGTYTHTHTHTHTNTHISKSHHTQLPFHTHTHTHTHTHQHNQTQTD